MNALWNAVVNIIYYGIPLGAGFLVYRWGKKKYARPLHERTDWRVYIFTVMAVSGGFIISVLLLLFINFCFSA